MSNFRKVCVMNEAFGIKSSTLDDVDWDAVKRQRDMLVSEIKELDDAIAEKDTVKFVDAAADIAVFNYGFGHIARFKFDHIMDMVYQSNISKICKDRDQVERTIRFYNDLGVDVYSQTCCEGWTIRASREQHHPKLGHIPQFKVLKNVDYQPLVIDLDEICR